MKNVLKKVITMVMAIAICCSIMTVSAYASEKTDGVITETHVVSQEIWQLSIVLRIQKIHISNGAI